MTHLIADHLASRGDSHLFTVRLWPGTGAERGTGWRGRATHVLSGETRHFRDWPALLEFLSAALADQAVIGMETNTISGEDEMNNEMNNEEHAQRHCLMISQEAGEGTPGSAIIWYLDWLDDQGVPHAEHLDNPYQGFKQLGADGWRLVQVIERPAGEGVYDGPVGPATHYYFTRPARARG